MKALTIRQQVNRINKYLTVASASEFSQGLNWYSEARCLCVQLSERYHVSLSQVAQVISVLSPQKKKMGNKQARSGGVIQ